MFTVEKITSDYEFLGKCNTIQRVKPNVRLLVNVSEDEEKPIFFYDFFGTVFKIENATNVQLMNTIEEHDGFTSQVLLALTEKVLYIVSFCSYHNRNDVLSQSSARFRFLTYIDTHRLSSAVLTTSKNVYTLPQLRFVSKDGWNYIVWNMNNHVAAGNKADIVRFNNHDAMAYTIPHNAVLMNRDNTHNTLPKYVITCDEIFDVDSFRTYNLKDLFSTHKLYYKNLFYRIFSTGSGRKFLFIYKNDVNFRSLRNSKNNHFSKGISVNGFLYDLENHDIILGNEETPGKPWLKFFLYDDMIPHVYKTTSELGENVFCICFYDNNKHKFSKIFAKDKPIFVSYQKMNDSFLMSKSRYIFMTAADKENHDFPKNSIIREIVSADIMLAIDENLTIENADSYVKLASVIFTSDDLPIVDISKFEAKAFYLSGSDAIILKSYKGELGENVLMFLNNGTHINYSLSFFDYQRVVLGLNTKKRANCHYANSEYIKVMCAQNDFENETFIVNLHTHKIYTIDEFARHLT